MSLNDTVSAERLHIAFFGKRNVGKSSLVNAVTGQKLSVVSPVRGTTTDPVKKAMELLPLGPVVIIDTPGYDDEGELGELRVEKTNEVLNKTEIAVLVFDAAQGLTGEDKALLARLKARRLPVILAANKCDLAEPSPSGEGGTASAVTDEGRPIFVSALTGEGVRELKERLADLGRAAQKTKFILADLVSPGDTVILVIPIDESAPKGRLILPQQQTLRELLDLHCVPVCCQPEELPALLDSLKTPPGLVVTDSQAFGKVSPMVPASIRLTSFSILFARYKGRLSALVRGARALAGLRDGDRVLISEGCTHHRQCSDIGTVKLPGWVRNYSGSEPDFTFSSGGEFPEDLTGYALVIHCGGCMLNEAAMQHRLDLAARCGVPMVNYGVAIAQMHGILERSLQPFEDELN